MINLIPDYFKQNIRYGIKNTKLIRYTWALATTAIAIALIAAFGIIGMQQSHVNLQKDLDSQNAQLASLKQVEEKGQKLFEQISTIDQLLTKQIKFSEVLPEIAKVLPPGAILTQLDFSSTDLVAEAAKTPANAKAPEKPFVLSAAVTERAIAATLLENIKARGDLFTNADLIEVSAVAVPNSGGTSGTQNTNSNTNSLALKYPYKVTINAYFKKQQTTTPAPAANAAGGNAQ